MKVSIIVSLLSLLAAAAVPAYERAILLKLYNTANGKTWTTQTGWAEQSADVCTWHGIGCGDVDGVQHVTSIALTGNNVTGTLPDDLGVLKHLISFDFGGNALTGSFPSSVPNMTSLYAISLRGNQMSGPLPEIPAPMVFCHLDGNKFTGSLSVFDKCTGLKVLGMTDNRMSGSIPDSLAKNENLQTLFLGGNELSGDIPAFTAPALTGLDLSRNKFTGELPIAQLMALPALQELLLFSNDVEGGVTSAISTEALVVIDLHGNKLTGELPDILAKGQINGLVLHLQDNEFNGYLSETFVASNIYDIDLAGNPFKCPLPQGATEKTGATCTTLRGAKAARKVDLPVADPVVPTNAAPVEVHIHGMSKCPDEGSILTIFSDVVNKLGEDVVNVSLGWIAEESSDYPSGFWSMHGQTEAIGNAMISCAASIYGMKAALNYATCLSVNISLIPINSPTCASEYNMDDNLIKDCAFSEAGVNFMNQAIALAKEDNAIWSPSVYINGELYCLWHSLPCKAASEKDFGKYVCEVYTGSRPAACDEFQ